MALLVLAMAAAVVVVLGVALFGLVAALFLLALFAGRLKEGASSHRARSVPLFRTPWGRSRYRQQGSAEQH